MFELPSQFRGNEIYPCPLVHATQLALWYARVLLEGEDHPSALYLHLSPEGASGALSILQCVSQSVV